VLGFLRPNRLDLTIRQNQNYFHSQCGLCQQLKNDYGVMSRFLVNRDALVLQLLTEAQMDVEPIHCKIRCGVQPFLHSAKANPKAAEFAAAVTVMMVWGKLTDTVNDSKGLSGFFSRHVAKFLLWKNRQRIEKAEKKLAELNFDVQVIYDLFKKQQKMEKSVAISNLDEAASPTAEGLSALFAHTAVLANRPENIEMLKILGREIGAIVYILDARNDLTSDIKKGQFNPLKFSVCANDESTQLFDIEDKATIFLRERHKILNEKFSNFEANHHQEILANIFDSGLENSIEQKKQCCVHRKKRNSRTISILKTRLAGDDCSQFGLFYETTMYCTDIETKEGCLHNLCWWQDLLDLIKCIIETKEKCEEGSLHCINSCSDCCDGCKNFPEKCSYKCKEFCDECEECGCGECVRGICDSCEEGCNSCK